MPAADTPPPSVSESADLTWSEAGEPRSARFGDVYFSRDDGLAESRAVFLAGCGLPQAWAGRAAFTVVELGFGTGLNIVALIALWRAHRPVGGTLHIVTVEAFPLSADEAGRALSAWPEMADIAGPLVARWPSRTPGFHRVDLEEPGVVLDVLIGDAARVLGDWQGWADAWFLDGFSPALNPEMWSDAVMDAIAARSAPGARVATFTVAGAVRRGLSERGFVVEKQPGHGRKRQRLEARLAEAPSVQPPLPSVAVIGAGIAGASVARALTRQGAKVVVLDASGPGAEASGFPAALVTPRLDAGDALIAGLHAQALERARHLYEAVPGAVLAMGVTQLEQAERDGRRYGRIATQALWEADAMTTVSPDTASARVGEPVPMGGLVMAGALTVAPRRVLEAWLAGTDQRVGAVTRLEPVALGWRVIGTDDAVLATVDAVVVAGGWGTAALLDDLPLGPVRGQADWVEGPTSPAIAWGGYVAPTDTGFLFGATHDRNDTATDVRPADTLRNQTTLAGRLPALAGRVAGQAGGAKAAIRATTPDRLPICGPMADHPGLYVLGGLGSRGFCMAPLLGEHLAAVIAGVPSPLPEAYAMRLSPDRFGSPLSDSEKTGSRESNR